MTILIVQYMCEVITILELIPKLFSILFVVLVYIFIIKIIQMVNSDIAVMMKQKSKGEDIGTYLKLLNIRSSLDFPVSESYEIAADVTIGRNRQCEICIDDPFLSNKHAEILVRDKVCYLHDLGSTNGTRLNGEALEGDPIELINGDKITFGNLSFIFITDYEE